MTEESLRQINKGDFSSGERNLGHDAEDALYYRAFVSRHSFYMSFAILAFSMYLSGIYGLSTDVTLRLERVISCTRFVEGEISSS